MTQGGGRKIVSVGNYRFTGKRLGKGNFARVDEAIHTVLNIKVAVKIMDVTQIREDYVIKNLYREAKILSKLRHPCIVSLFQTMQYGNLYYLVTELVGGGDLCSFIKGQRLGKLEERHTRFYARQLASAVAHMHNLGIVHRDLKMENVMLNTIHTQLKIVDFGLSNVYNQNNPLRTHCGSPEYAAPELFIAGRQYGPEVDLWSLGVILYGMVVGQLPFVTSRTEHVPSPERRKRLLSQINKGLATPHRKALANMSPDYRTLMSKLLITDSSKRITIKELLFHPWITEKGSKEIRINPMKRLDDHHHRRIVYELGKLLHTESDSIQRSITEERQGNITGMYNMLMYKQQIQQLDGDGITKIVQQPAPSFCTPRPQSSYECKVKPTVMQNTKRSEPIKSAPAHRIHLVKVKEALELKLDVSTHRPSTSTGKRTSEAMAAHAETRAASATIGGRIYVSPLQKCNVGNEKVKYPSKEVTSVRSPLRIERPLTPSPVRILYNNDMKISELKKCAERVCNPQVTQRPCSKSEPLSNNDGRRRLSTGPVHTAERALKRRSMLPVVATQSSPTRGINVLDDKSPTMRNKRVTSSKIPVCLEKSVHGTGDCKRPSSTPAKKVPQSNTRPISKPIARTIAEYVSSNPARLKAFKLLKSPPQPKGYFNP